MLPTVTATPIDNYPAWLLAWEHTVNKTDVAPAFRALVQALEASAQPLWIVVDLHNDPVFPLHETITSALWGPFRHKQLREWLVVGSNNTAHLIGRTLSGITGRKNILWFKTIQEVYEYMDHVLVSG